MVDTTDMESQLQRQQRTERRLRAADTLSEDTEMFYIHPSVMDNIRLAPLEEDEVSDFPLRALQRASTGVVSVDFEFLRTGSVDVGRDDIMSDDDEQPYDRQHSM